ncbi:hypothetical protein SDC9_68241 [bioreactor metagenome]|uniref:Uncharacterized protein n=1 Tax=bioreactor metagenome TaxID=1076179 RepID=A0A644Y1K9_9ZZZZ
MPANIESLLTCMATMKEDYVRSPNASVRSSSFIYILHQYCIAQLRQAISPEFGVQVIPLADMNRPVNSTNYPRVRIDPEKLQLMQEVALFGSHKNKNTDIVLSHFSNGPQIIIGIRSQMSSVGKNIENYYEGIIGECISLHDRFPMAVIGYVYLLPTCSIKPGVDEVPDLEKAERLFSKITSRPDWRSAHDKYEHFAFLKVDFTTPTPTLLPTLPELEIGSFFDKLIETYNDRNVFNQIERSV